MIEAATQGVHGGWSPPLVVSGPQPVAQPLGMTLAKRRAIVSWIRRPGTGTVFEAATWDRRTAWSSPRRLLAVDGDVFSAALGVSHNGRHAAAIWQTSPADFYGYPTASVIRVAVADGDGDGDD